MSSFGSMLNIETGKGGNSESSTSGEVINSGYTREGFIQECAMRIFAESDFDRNATKDLVKKAVNNAKALANQLF